MTYAEFNALLNLIDAMIQNHDYDDSDSNKALRIALSKAKELLVEEPNAKQ
jgi:hypothetical protein